MGGFTRKGFEGGRHNFCLGTIGQNCCVVKYNYKKFCWIWCSFLGRKGNQFTKNTQSSAAVYTGVVVLSFVLAVACCLLQGVRVRGVSFCYRRRHA